MAAAWVRGRDWWRRHPLVGFTVRRLRRLILSLGLLLVLSFAMIQLVPGDPVRAALGVRAPAERVEQVRHQLWLDRPVPTQFTHYVGGVVSGDFGTSMTFNLPVAEIIGDRLPNTVALAGMAFAIIMLVAVPLGMAAAILTRGGGPRGADLTFTTMTGVLAIVPEFLLGVGLVYIFAVRLGWLPVAGKAGPSSFVLPLAALCIGSIAALARVVRMEMLKTLDDDYMRTARSKRLPARLLYLRHALPNMLTATLTIAGLLLSGLIGGAVLVENVFAWPGIGTIVAQAVVQQDYALAQAIVLFLGTTVLVVNFIVDLVLGALDPRSTIRDA
jgi:peptide/nickel transport system permease protein